MSNPSAETPQSMRYLFPPRPVIVQGDEASNPPRKRFRLFWGQFIRHAAKKAPIDRDILYALDLFNEIEFNVSQETWNSLEDMLSAAVSLSENRLLPRPINAMWASETAAEGYFDALYSPENHSSHVHPATLRMIAKYLFAVINLPRGATIGFARPNADDLRGLGDGEGQHRVFHTKAAHAIGGHYCAWAKAEESYPESLKKEEEQQRAAEKAAEQQPHVEPYAFPETCTYPNMLDGSPKTFLLNWFDFFDVAKEKVGFPQKLDFVLSGFAEVEFTFSREEWDQLKDLRERAKQFSNRPQTLLPDGSFACESLAHGYFEHLYARGDNNSSINPNTLRLIAKYLFAVRNLSSERALPFVESNPSYRKAMLKFEENKDAVSANIHKQVYYEIIKHWQSWCAAEKASEQVEYAQAPEAPIQPAEPLETPDMDALMRRAFAAFEEGKPLAEAGMVVCDAFGLREVYEEQLKDPKNRAILALGETLLRTVQSVLRPSAPPEKPFVMSAPPEDTARPRTPADPPAAPLMSDVVKDMIEKQQQHHAAKNAEIDAAYRQRDEQIRQAKAIADAECQDALDRINRGYAKGEEGVWLPLGGNAQQALPPQGDWEGFRRQAIAGDKPIAQILADLKAKADEQHELSEKIRERFAGKGEDFVEQLRKRVVRRKNNGN